MEFNQLVMCPDKEKEWILAKITGNEGSKILVVTEDKQELLVSQDSVIRVTEKSVEDTDDMCKLPELHESLILHNIRRRYMNDIIYTYIGPMIVSVNPYKIIQNYGEHLIPDYKTKDKEELRPHLFSIAQKACRSLVDFGNSQAVVISGESGAGKTEATKIVLRYLTAQMGTKEKEADLAQMILATNPVLEAFGNAKTIRNNNSSRFGKFIKIIFDGSKISSARIDNYLLEKTRVVSQAPNERNYHIFYQFVKGLSPEEKAKYLVKESCEEYDYLTNGEMKVDGIDDKESFISTCHSLKVLGFSESEVAQIFSLLSAILTLGNITFSGDDQATIKDEVAFKDFCQLLGVYEGLTRQSLTVRLFSAARRGTGYKVPLTYAEAIENRDALAKTLYHRLFEWLVKKLNKSLKHDKDQKDTKFIGILDIYGFEIFTKNSLEQFCINYANEKLHQQFNHHMFKAEQSEYVKEGVPWKEILFKDNQGCIDLIEKPFSGIISLMDEEARVPQGSNEGLLLRLDKKFLRNIWYEHHPKDPDQFMIKHFAGTVTYKITNFLEKNKDTLYPDLLKTCKASSHDIVREFFEGETSESEKVEGEEEKKEENSSVRRSGVLSAKTSPALFNGRSRGRTVIEEQKPDAINDKRAKASVTTKFKDELTILVDTLATAERHYVRCIKPNDEKKILSFDSTKVLSQLACNGVFETVTLRKAGFSHRMEFSAFIDKYFVCLGCHPRTKEGITAFLSEYLEDTHNWAVGHSKVFLRDIALAKIGERQAYLWKGMATTIQARIRAYYALLKLEHLLRLAAGTCVLQKYVRRELARLSFVVLKREFEIRFRAATTMQAFFRRNIALHTFSDMKIIFYAASNLQKYIRHMRAVEELHTLREGYSKRSEEERRRLDEEQARRRREEEDRRRWEEEDRHRREEEDRRRKEDEDRRRREDEDRHRREEEDRRRREEDDRRRRKEDDDRRRKEEEEDRIRKDEDRRRREEEIRKETEETNDEQKPNKSRLRVPQLRLPSNKQPRTSKKSLPPEESDDEDDLDEAFKELEVPAYTNTKLTPVKNLSLQLPKAETSRSGGLHRSHEPSSKQPNISSDLIFASLSPRGTKLPLRNSAIAPGQAPSYTSPLTPRSSRLVARPATSASKGLVFDLTQEDKSKLLSFFDNLGIPDLADVFAQQAIDLETMLAWDNPVQQLQALGILQQGVIFRVVKAIEAFNVQNGNDVIIQNSEPEKPPATPQIMTNSRARSKSHIGPPGLPGYVSPRAPPSSPIVLPRGSFTPMTTTTPGPAMSFTIHFQSGHFLPQAKTTLLSKMDLYVKCDVRSFNKRMCNYRTSSCRNTTNPTWNYEVPYNPTILPGMNLCIEVWDGSSFLGDQKVADCIWDWHKLQTLHNGPLWIPIKFQGECAGELLISIANFIEKKVECKWQPDILGGRYESVSLPLLPSTFGSLTATLVRLRCQEETNVGILYIHSFSDYFFNSMLGEVCVDEGYHFYALDLRRYGRSMASNQASPNWTTNLWEYFEEIHTAIDYMRRIEAIEKVVLCAHGLGGLISILFAEKHHQLIDALCLNSPLLALNKYWTDFMNKKRGWFGNKGNPLAKHVAFSTLYHQSLDRRFYGEWSWDDRLKPLQGWPIFLGWIDVLLDHIKHIETGLDIPVPILVMVAAGGCVPGYWKEELRTCDAVMDVSRVVQVVPMLSSIVKLVVVKDGVHDLFLSEKKVREGVYATMFDYLEKTLWGE